MPCMCGDLYCWSCGPAQGNFKCPFCGKWTEDGGCEDGAECDRMEQEAEMKYQEQLEQLKDEAEEVF